MHLLPPSQYIFPNPLEVDPEGEGLICIGADLSLPHFLKPIRMVYFHGFQKVIRFAGGVRNRVALFAPKITIQANPCYAI